MSATATATDRLDTANAALLCGRTLRRLDWWHLDEVSVPCCAGNEGCRQKGGAS